MKIERNNTSFELTAAELETAYRERHMQYLVEDAKHRSEDCLDQDYLDSMDEGNLPPTSVTGGMRMISTSSGFTPSIPNQPYYLYFSLNKLSSINGHRVSGAAFTIKTNQDLTAKETANFSGFLASRAGQSFTAGDVLCSFVTNNTSNCVAYGLPLGGANADGDFEYTYTIQEYNVGSPFIIDDTEFTISANLSDFNQSASSSLHMPLVVKRSTVYNDAAMAVLTVTKKDAESDSPLRGAQFQFVAVNDLIVDGDTLQSSGDVIEFVDSTDEENPITINTLETDENGILKTKFWYCTDENGQQHIYYDEPDGVQAREGYLPLYRNVEYKLVEVKAPEGYEIDETQNNQIICVKNASSDDAKTKFLYTSKTITNTRQKGSITVYKVDENDNQIKLQGAEFSIYAAEDVTIEGVEYKSGRCSIQFDLYK